MNSCQCGNCVAMGTGRENIYCKEKPLVFERWMPQGLSALQTIHDLSLQVWANM